MAGLTDNSMKSGIRTGADENNPSLFFIAAGLVFYRVKWYNKNVCGAKTASGVIGDCQNRKQEDLFP
ncbi:MAG: hypothetical protein EGP94_10405 [Lachnospiraceae bacterium]|nr:hypothetical protein [Lachnospiraceae bacterium]